MPATVRSIVALVVAAVITSACSAAADAPSSVASPVAVTPTIAPTPRPSATPKPLTAGQIATRAFVDKVTRGALSYHVAAKGDIVGAVNGLTIVATLDVAGDDYAEVATYSFPTPPSSTVSIRAVGTKYWIRADRAAWQRVTSSMPSAIPLAGVLGYDDVQLLATERANGKYQYRLSIANAGRIISPDLVPVDNLTSEKVDRTKLEIIVDEHGTPLRGTWQLDGTARVSGQLQGIRVDLDITFSKVGSKIVIKAP